LDASTDERGQAEIIKGFGSAGPDTVLLASLKTSVFGINLIAAWSHGGTQLMRSRQ
jgi:SWI/SNF-related matrix-associated actin-dependent regulator of chromatin subfamily A3